MTSSTSPRSFSSAQTDLSHSTPLAAGRVARVRFTARADGDLRIGAPSDELDERRSRIVDRPWTWLHQQHGALVVSVTRPDQSAGVAADGAVTGRTGAPLAVQTADCAPVALVSPEGVVGVAHAGWRGLVAGIVERTVTAMGDLGARSVRALVGPMIGPECYQFGPDELAEVSAAVGRDVSATTTEGELALDLPAAVAAALDAAGAETVWQADACTACGPYFSHRARGDRGRQAVVTWIDGS